MIATALLVASLGQYAFCPSGNISNPATCTMHGDPVDLNYGGYVLTREDTPPGGDEPRLLRYFSSKEDTWTYGSKDPVNRPVGSVQGVPKPFGEATDGLAMHWWHNWFSFVEVHGSAQGAATLYVRQPGGRTTQWAQGSCTGAWLGASPKQFNTDEALKVRCLPSGGYEVVVEDGAVLTYAALIANSAPSSTRGSILRYFLTKKTTPTATVDVEYAQPRSAAGPLTACPRPAADSWVPYVSRVRERRTGATLAFAYEEVRSQGEARCPLRLVSSGHTPAVLTGGSTTLPLVEYSAIPTSPAPAPQPGGGIGSTSGGPPAGARWRPEVRLSLVRYAEGPSTWREVERYGYEMKLADRTCLPTPRQAPGGRRCEQVPVFRYAAPRQVPTEVELDASGTVVTRVSSSEQDIAYGLTSRSATSTLITTMGVGVGGARVSRKSEWGRVLSVGTHSGRLATVTHDTSMAVSEAAFPPGNPAWDWLDGSGGHSLRLATSAAGIRTLTSHERSAETTGGAFLSSVHRGVAAGPLPASRSPQTPGVCLGLECTWWSSLTDATGAVRPGVERRASRLVAGALSETRHAYHSSGLLKSTIQKGWTLDVTGVVIERYVGTFYRLQRTSIRGCVGGSDPGGRIVEVEGPCEVDDFEAETCRQPDSRLLQYVYHPTSSLSLEPEGGKVAAVHEYPNGCDGTALTTQFPSYHPSGQPLSVVDVNGNPTDFTYDAHGRVLSRTSAGATWAVGYTSHGKVAWVRKPEGNYLVFCYAPAGDVVGPPPASCPTDTPQGERVAWVAIAPNADGSGWLAARRDRWALGQLVGQEYFEPGGASTREVSFDFNERGALAGAFEGPRASSAPSAELRNADGLRLALGPAENLPPAYCIENGAVSPRCHRFSYDAAGRLTEVVRALDATHSVTERLKYDVGGALCEVGPEVDVTTACGNGANTTLAYQTDDFGNVVRAVLPNTGTAAKATAIFSHDAAGNLVRAYRPGDYPWKFVEHRRDRSGRLTALVENDLGPSHVGPAEVSTFTLRYDEAARPPGCEGGQNTKGRLAAVIHPTGTTFFGYDEAGRVVVENSVRLDAVSCSQGPRTNFLMARTFTPNGNEEVLVVGSRLIVYEHGSNGAQDLVRNVYVRTFDAQGGASMLPVARAVRWRADGQLAGYEAWLPEAASWLPVSYQYGPDGRLTAVEAGEQFRQAYEYVTGGKTTPLLRSVRTRYGTAPEHHEGFFYDAAGRLTGWTRDLFAPGGRSLTFTYDARGNRIGLGGLGAVGGVSEYAGGAQPDQLRVERRGLAGTHVRTDYAHDEAGRTTAARWAPDSHGGPAGQHVYSYSGESSAAGLGTAVRVLSVNGAAYTYAFDLSQRRRTKFSPVYGGRDDFAYALGSPEALQWDLSDNRTLGEKVEDVYVWLGGRPIAAVRGRYGRTWVREGDDSTDCSRPGVAGELSDVPCGLKHILSDYSPKPIYAVDGSGRVVGVAEYSPFGAVNTREVWAETAHPYANNAAEQLASWSEPLDGLWQDVRFEFDSFDLEPDRDFVTLLDAAGDVRARFTGRHGRWVSPWYGTSGGSQSLQFSSDAWNCEPGVTLCGPIQPNRPYAGVALRRVQYQRRAPGVAAWLPPLRFPGQYYDEESGLHENWNRFYSNRGGIYLSPEPLLREPDWVTAEGAGGFATPTYVYARNNPQRYLDSSGLQAVDSATSACARNPEMCEAMLGSAAAGAAASAAAAAAAGASAAASKKECDRPQGPQSPSPQFEICTNTGLGNPFRPEVACEYQCPSGRKVYLPEIFGKCLPITISRRPGGN